MSSSSKARQRVDSLLDGNSFVEVGALVTARATNFNLKPEKTPSDGVITGYGTIGGNLVFVYSQDASVLGGSIGEMHARKISDLYNLALKMGAPVIGLLDSAGFRLQEGIDALGAFGTIYAQQAKASGVIPQIAAVFGSCGGGLSLIPGMSDFAFMAKDAKLFVNSPNALPGNSQDKNDTSGAQAKAKSGNVDAVGSEEEILEMIRELITLLPSNNEDEAVCDCEDDLNRESAAVENGIADPSVTAADLSDGGVFFETKKEYAKEMATGFIRLNGATVGIVANRSALYDEKGEAAEEFENSLTAQGAEKAAGFVTFCDAFEIPVITLTNVNGFRACECNEKRVAKAAAGLASAFAGATVPKVNVIVGSAVGSAYNVMNSKALGADLTIALPSAKVGVMDAALAAKILAAGKDGDAVRSAAEEYDQLQNGIESAASHGYIDQIVEAGELRKYLIGALEMLYTKREDVPSRKHASV